MSFIQTFRWFGPKDPVSLSDIRQAGATGVVTALHQFPYGELWPTDSIMERKAEIEARGMTWEVVESVPVHEDIKRRTGDHQAYIDNYKETIRNIGACGIPTICYNFMPVLDWTRTDVAWELEDGSKALRFEWRAFAAFDLYILKRPGAEDDYSEKLKQQAAAYYKSMDEAQKDKLLKTVFMGFPGSGDTFSYTPEQFLEVLETYKDIDAGTLKENLFLFLKEIVPVAEEAGVNLAMHPDDPPFSLLGLPRVVSTEQDFIDMTQAVDSPNNGFTYCPGSLGANPDNDLLSIVDNLAHRINFLHLRTVERDAEGNFHEANHLEGTADMYTIVKKLVLEERRRVREGRKDHRIPMRPDHGHQMLDDLNKTTYPGYTAIGRLKGLAELRGLEMGIERSI